MRIKETKVYKFSELSDEAKQAAIEKLYDINTNYEWYEFVFDDAKTIAALMGINITNIYFSGFSSQGDGACFEGKYEYKRGGIKAVKDYAPADTELHRIVTELQAEQMKCFYQIRANVKHRGHYSHEHCTDISVDFENYNTGANHYSEDAEENIIELLRDYMRWIYRTLEKEYEYQTSEEAIIETIEANDYEFTEDGKLS